MRLYISKLILNNVHCTISLKLDFLNNIFTVEGITSSDIKNTVEYYCKDILLIEVMVKHVIDVLNLKTSKHYNNNISTTNFIRNVLSENNFIEIK